MQRYITKLKAMKRDTLVTIGAALLVGVGLLLLFFFTYNNSSSIVITNISPATVVVPFTKLIQGEQNVVERRVNYVLTSSDQLSELWKTIDASGKPPTVNFKTHTVLAVFAGKESITSIAVAKIEDTSTRKVSIAITKPDCTVPPSSTSPYEIIAVPVTALSLVHTDISTIVPCSR